MASLLVLVIVVVVVGTTIAAVAFLRSRQAPAPGRNVPASGRVGIDEPSKLDVARTAAKESDNSPAAPQPPETTQPPAITSTVHADTSTEHTNASTGHAGLPSPTRKDNSELDFTLEIPDKTGTESGAPIATGSPRDTAAPGSTAVPGSSAGRGGSGVPAGSAVPGAPALLQPAEIFAKLFELALGKPRPASTVTAGHDDVAAAVSAAIEDVATQERYAPRRPNMLPKVLSASNDDSFSRRDLATLIARDPSLVGNLLKIANSSYYRVTPEPVESVDRAVVLLGTDGIRSLCTAALMQPIFRIGGADFPRFPEIAWEHTFRSASASVPYNFLMEKSDPFAAELLSLVMGLAKIVIFRMTIDQYARYPRLRPDASVVTSMLDKHAAVVARRIGKSWDLSEPTLAGLDGQVTTTASYPTPLGRSLYFGRVVGALAVLRLNRIIDDRTGQASIPATSIPEPQLERMWSRLTCEAEKH